jgi:hypothetical protein
MDIITLFFLLAYKLLLCALKAHQKRLIMKKILYCIIGTVFLLSATAFAVEKATPTVKAAKMHATGKVIEISNEAIKIERTLKGDMESMEFSLDMPVADVGVNDSVKIEYMEKDGKLVASRVVKVIVKKKDFKPIEVKPAPGKK